MVLLRALPQLKVFEKEMDKIESNLIEATEKDKDVGDSLPFINEALVILEVLTSCCFKSLRMNLVNIKKEEDLSLGT